MNKRVVSLLKWYNYLALLPKEQKMGTHDKRKIYPKALNLLAWYTITDISNCLLNDLQSFMSKIMYVGVEYSQAMDGLQSEFSSLSLILNILKEFWQLESDKLFALLLIDTDSFQIPWEVVLHNRWKIILSF